MNSKEREALDKLVSKYEVPCTAEDLAEDIPLQQWRAARKYNELRNLISSNTVEHPCLLRFCHLTGTGTPLKEIIYREFDLCEFITGHKLTALHATFTDDCSGNIIVKLDNGVIGSVEIGNRLPEGTPEVDRHEIIGRRGVASDIVVDTQIPQQSIFLYTNEGGKSYTDTDSELFGLSASEIENVRAKFEYLKDKSTREWHIAQDKRMKDAVAAAMESNETHKKIEL